MQRPKDIGSAGNNEIPQLVPFPVPLPAPAPSAARSHWMFVAGAVLALLLAIVVAWWSSALAPRFVM